MDKEHIKKIWTENMLISGSDQKPGLTYRGKTHPYFAEKNLGLEIPVFKIQYDIQNRDEYPYNKKTIRDSRVQDTKPEVLETLEDASQLKDSQITEKEELKTVLKGSSELDTLDIEEILEKEKQDTKKYKKTSDEVAKTNEPESDYEDFLSIPLPSYKIEGEIARGGMGVVYKAKQSSLKRNVAIKQILPDSWTPSVQEKFVAEATVTAYLNHPNIPSVYDLGQSEEGDIMITMQLVEGISWVVLLYPETPDENELAEKYSEEDHIQILLNICNAVAFAHSKGISHNDLKPENIMIGAFQEVYIMDWGIAVDLWEDREENLPIVKKHMVRRPMGTPSYMPKELATGDGERIGTWTDVYLLGGLLYEIIERKPPRTGDTALDVLDTAVEGRVPEFSDFVSSELKQICFKALAKNPEERYQSAVDMQNDIKDYLQHKQSLMITRASEKTLRECLDNTTNYENQEDYIRCYDSLAKAVAGFEQALLLWQDNVAALEHKKNAQIEYAKIALKNGDILLAESQIAQIDKSAQEVKGIHQEINEVKEKRAQIKKMTRRLYWGIAVAIVVIICGLLTVLLSIQEKQQKMAFQYATLYATSLAEFRSAYSSKIVNKVTKKGIETSHDYTKDNEIPFPATFSIELGEMISKNKDGIKARLYSNYPFPWRKDGGPRDEFEKQALVEVLKNPDEAYTKIEIYNKIPSLRYAKAVILSESCVKCHNEHEQTPRTGWKQGDVRGIQEIIIPLGSTVQEVKKLTFSMFLPLTILGLLIIFVVGMIISRKLGRDGAIS